MKQITSFIDDNAALLLARSQMVAGYKEQAQKAGRNINPAVNDFYSTNVGLDSNEGFDSFFIISNGYLYVSILENPDPYGGDLNPYGCGVRWTKRLVAEVTEYEQWLLHGSTFLLKGRAKTHAEFFDSGELIPTYRKLKELKQQSDSKEQLSDRIKEYLSTLDKEDWSRAMLNIENNPELFPFDNRSECRLEDCPCGCGAVLGQTWYV